MSTPERRAAPSAPWTVGVAVDGVGWHPAAWREGAASAGPPSVADVLDPDTWIDVAATVERAGFDYLALEDAFAIQNDGTGAPAPRTDRLRGRLDSTLVASFLAPLTTHLGLLPTVVVTHTEPFHAAKAIATLDHASLGRAGVRLRVGLGRREARLVGRRDLPEVTAESLEDAEVRAAIDDAFAEADDYAEAVRRLWDTWEDDAEIRDVATGRFIDREKVHYADFVGSWFSVKGPLTVPRSPQGQPVVAVLGHGTLPYRLAVSQADLLWVTPRDAGHAGAIVGEVRELEAAAARESAPVRVAGDVVVVLGSDAVDAAARRARLDELAGEPLRSDAHVFTGSSEELVELVEAWSGAGLDGVRFRPATHQTDLRLLADEVLPALRRRGLAGAAGDSGAPTLRARLGLERPVSRYATTEAR